MGGIKQVRIADPKGAPGGGILVIFSRLSPKNSEKFFITLGLTNLCFTQKKTVFMLFSSRNKGEVNASVYIDNNKYGTVLITCRR